MTMVQVQAPGTSALAFAVDGCRSAPPKYIRTAVAKAVEVRNSMVRTGEASFNTLDLSTLLDAMTDVLYLFDFYCGNVWALDMISFEFRHAMGT